MLQATTRPLSRAVYRDLTLDEFGSVNASSALPPYARLNAAGRIYSLNNHAGTEVIPVVAPPVASPEWLLYNYSATDTLVLIQVHTFLKSGTLGLGAAIMAAAPLGAQTAVTADYAGTVKTCMSGTKAIPEVYLANNQSLVGGTPSWVTLEGTKHNSVGTNSVGDSLISWPRGCMIARPKGGCLAFEIVAETGTDAAYTIGFIFAMVPLETY